MAFEKYSCRLPHFAGCCITASALFRSRHIRRPVPDVMNSRMSPSLLESTCQGAPELLLLSGLALPCFLASVGGWPWGTGQLS